MPLFAHSALGLLLEWCGTPHATSLHGGLARGSLISIKKFLGWSPKCFEGQVYMCCYLSYQSRQLMLPLWA
ncbi:hypothetical protein P692DRAFT_20828918 [Suillus brevipes Sb2]|nr:hypothetical protein P692DRAFT_20828918 [Suillus brevipes Sb2]